MIVAENNPNDDKRKLYEKNIPWIEKYRPTKLKDIKSHKKIIHGIKKYMKNENMPNCIFYGPPGTGKTTTVLACIREFYGSDADLMTISINGSDDKGIGIVRNEIKTFSGFSNLNKFTKNKRLHKIVIIDEADCMTFDAQFSLISVIESSIDSTRFCLTCNLSYKIIDQLKSRCISYRFEPIKSEEHLEHLKFICEKESIRINLNVLETLVYLSQGDMRRSINTLQCLAFTYKNILIDKDKLYTSISAPKEEERIELVTKLQENDFSSFYEFLKFLVNEKSYGVADILKILFEEYVKKNPNNLPDIKIIEIIRDFSNIEQNLSKTYNTNIQLSAIVSSLK